jgi:CRP-like cAMP-binding protein
MVFASAHASSSSPACVSQHDDLSIVESTHQVYHCLRGPSKRAEVSRFDPGVASHTELDSTLPMVLNGTHVDIGGTILVLGGAIVKSAIRGAEVFVPVLVDGMTRFSIDDGNFLLSGPAGQYCSVRQADIQFVDLMDGSRSLSQILSDTARSGQGMPSVRKLISLIHRLHCHELISNSTDDLTSHGFINLGRRQEPLHAVLRLFFGVRISLPSARHLAVYASKVLGCVPMPTWLLGLVVVGTLVFASMVGLAELDRAFDRVRPMAVLGRSGLGVLSIYLGCWFALVLRMFFRTWSLGAMRVVPYTIGVQIPLLLLAPYVDGRRAKRKGRSAEIKLALAGICGVAVATLLCMIGIVSMPAPQKHVFGLMTVGALGVFLGVICPFSNTDTGRILDAMYPQGEGRVHLTKYLHHRYLSRLASGHYFAGEAHLIFMAAVNVVWFYLCLKYFAGAFVELILPTIVNRFDGGGPLDVVLVTMCALVAVSCLAATLLFFVFSLFKICVELLPARSSLVVAAPDLSDIDRALLLNPVLARLSPASRSELATKVRCLQFSAGTDIVRQGDHGETFYIVLDGEADVLVSTESGVETKVATLVAGQCFGERALIEEETRNATVRAQGVLRVFELGRSTFFDTLEKADIELQNVTALIRSTQAIRRSPVFEDLSPAAMLSLQKRLGRASHQKDDIIFEQGSIGDRFYLVESGILAVLAGDPLEQIATLGPGEFFGEFALLYDSPRSATIRSTADGELLFLDRAQFREVMNRDFVSTLNIQDVAKSRVQQGGM